MTTTNDNLEKESIFDKRYTCPICDTEFKSKNVKTGKCKLDHTDRDLRPVYQNIDSLKYDVAYCPNCGYTALKKFYDHKILPIQEKNLKEKIAANFKQDTREFETYSYDDSIRMHKLALLSSMVKEAPMSEQAYTCLKIAWLFRGKAEQSTEAEQEKLKAEEAQYIQKAYVGFTDAYTKEEFPLAGMDEMTFSYLTGVLAYETGNFSEAKRWISTVITSHSASDRVKEKARDLKDLILKEVNEDEE